MAELARGEARGKAWPFSRPQLATEFARAAEALRIQKIAPSALLYLLACQGPRGSRSNAKASLGLA